MPRNNKTIYYNPGHRELYSGENYDTVQQGPATPRTAQQWMDANKAARLAAQPRAGPYSQLEQPVVSSMDPHQMIQNPLDPFQDNIYYMLSTFRGRNTNFDPRGQPEFSELHGVGQDQLVQPRNLARIDAHGPSHQITGCNAQKAPQY